MSLAGACRAGQAVVRRRGGASSVRALVRNVGTPGRDAVGGVLTLAGVRENLKQLICEGLSTEAWQGGGPPCSSGEVPVTGAERRGRVVLVRWDGQPECPGGTL